MTTIIYAHPVFGRHETPPGHVERQDRYGAVDAALLNEEFAALIRRTPPLVDPKDIEQVHPERYRLVVEENAPVTGMAQFDADTFMGPSSLEAARRGAGGAVAAVDAVFKGEADNAFVAARPPGHHAEPERAMGFCFFNNAAIAALRARQHGAQKVAVVDFDVHHGNGTEAAFWNDEDAFFASSHEWPQYPGTGKESDRGEYDNICNAPLPTGTDGEGFRRTWGDKLLPALSDFDPDFIVISAGFDGHAADPIGGFDLLEEDFAWATAQIKKIAQDKAKGRLVSVLEGGYDLGALGKSAAAHVNVLMGD